MYQAFPGSDYYGASVALGVAPGRQSHVPCAVDVQDGLGASFVSLLTVKDGPVPSERVPDEWNSPVLPKRNDSAAQEPRASSRMPWLTDCKSDTEIQAV